ncbi:MAG: LPS export ABC transporter periplasmic protein LptC [Desulfobacteraceae bacterium]|nr:LPS export ABC transporter periplasmic protein LptC [Desulfobacteraceae bacterium]
MNFKNISPGKLKLPLFCALIIILLITIALIVYKTKSIINPSFKNIEIDSSADIFLNNFKQTSKTNGIKEWALKAASAKIINAQNLTLLEDVSVTIFTEDNTQIDITAQNGKLNTKTHDIELSGRVIVHYEDIFLKTDKLHYKKKRHIIYSDGQVEIEKESSTIQADSLFADLKDSTLKLEGNVKGKFIETINQF